MLDLTASPYREVVALLAALREPEPDLSPVRRAPSTDRWGLPIDTHELRRGQVAHLLLLDSSAADLALIRFMIDEEIEARRNENHQDATGALTILSLLLLEHGDASDTWRFWEAKSANFDTWAGGYDYEFVQAWLSTPELLALAAERGDDWDQETLAGREQDRDEQRWAGWREALDRRFARSLATMGSREAERWARLFEDRAGVERLGLLNATGPAERARIDREVSADTAAPTLRPPSG